MKATIIIAAILFLQVSILFAGNNGPGKTVNNEIASFNMNLLAPITPEDATFEETTETIAFNFVFKTLAPVTPDEAGFSEVVPETNVDLSTLAPVTPFEADFIESADEQGAGICALAPVTPNEAEFE